MPRESINLERRVRELVRPKSLSRPILSRDIVLKKRLIGKAIGKRIVQNVVQREPGFLSVLRKASKVLRTKTGIAATIISMPILIGLYSRTALGEERIAVQDLLLVQNIIYLCQN